MNNSPRHVQTAVFALALALVAQDSTAGEASARSKSKSKRTAITAPQVPSTWGSAWQAPTEANPTQRSSTEQKRARKPQIGKASYYASRFHGRRTASGHLYYQDAYTAAHRTLPLGTWVRVTNMKNQRWVVVQITDRGPYAGNSRIIDLSRRSADELAMVDSGVVQVRIDVLQEYVRPAPDDTNLWDARFASL